MLDPLVATAGWAVLHSVWQTAVVYGLYRLLLPLCLPSSRWAYALALLALLSSAGMFVYTFGAYWAEISEERAMAPLLSVIEAPLEDDVFLTEGGSKAVASKSEDKWGQAVTWLGAVSPYVGWVWVCIVFVLYLRLAGAWWLTQRLGRRATVPLEALDVICAEWSQKWGIRRTVRCLESPFVGEPLTFGFWKPVILFPAGLALQLNPAQLEALLLHELAHIRRYDYLVNFLQLLLETCFFYHPLLHRISRDARRFREYCCDEAVLHDRPNKLLYAKTLTDLKLANIHVQNSLVMTSVGNKGFTERILRIVGTTPQNAQKQPTPWYSVATLLLVLVASGFWKNPSPALPSSEPLVLMEPNASASYAPLAKSVETSEAPTVLLAAAALPDSLLPLAAADPTKMNVLYIGVDNPITVAAPGFDCGQLSVALTGPGQLSQLSDCRYNATVTEPGTVDVRIRGKRNGKTVDLLNKTFRVKKLPDPWPRFGDFRAGSITVEELSKIKGVTVEQRTDYDITCEVLGYDITVIPRRSDPVVVMVQGATLSEQAKSLLATLGPGSALFVDDIRVKYPGEKEPRHIGGVSMKIKE